MDAPQCSRCSSSLVARTRSPVPTASVLELRNGDSPTEDPWLCSSCGHAWSPGSERAPEPRTEPHHHPRWLFGSERSAPIETADPPPRPSGPSHGSTLRAAREARGLSLEDVARVTSIWHPYLRALEMDAPPSRFPAPAYARFFLREYADFLGLDAGALTERFDERYPLEPDEEPPLAPTPRLRRLRVSRALAVLSVVALVAIAVIASTRSGSDPRAETPTEPPPSTTSEPPPVSSVAGGGDDAPAIAPERQVRAVLRFTAACWVQASTDGDVSVAETFAAGDRLVVLADRVLELTLGNAAGVELTVNGAAHATGDPGSVGELRFRLRDGRIVG